MYTYVFHCAFSIHHTCKHMCVYEWVCTQHGFPTHIAPSLYFFLSSKSSACKIHPVFVFLSPSPTCLWHAISHPLSLNPCKQHANIHTNPQKTTTNNKKNYLHLHLHLHPTFFTPFSPTTLQTALLQKIHHTLHPLTSAHAESQHHPAPPSCPICKGNNVCVCVCVEKKKLPKKKPILIFALSFFSHLHIQTQIKRRIPLHS